MAKLSQLARLETLENKLRPKDDRIVLIGRYDMGPDGITAYSKDDLERVIEVVPKAQARSWLASLIQIERSYGVAKE